MAKRRANGEGSIRKRKDGRWDGRCTAGRDPVTGKTIYKNVLGKTQAEVKVKLKPAIEKSGAGADTLPRPPAHIFRAGPAKRSRCQNPLRQAGALLGGFHPGHLRPRHHLRAEAGGKRCGEFPLRYFPALTALSSGMGHGLGQTGTAKIDHQKKHRKQEQNRRNSKNFSGFGTP